MLPTNRRGRPAGTDYKEDAEALCLVAERMLSNPGLRPSTAMWAVCRTRKWRGQTDEAIVARWLRKWKTQGQISLEAARQRRVAREANIVSASQAAANVFAAYAKLPIPSIADVAKLYIGEPAVLTAVKQITATLNTPEMQAVLEHHRKAAEALASIARQVEDASGCARGAGVTLAAVRCGGRRTRSAGRWEASP